MKKNIGKRILSLALALVMVAGMMPHMATEAHAAGPITLEGDSFTTDPGQGFTFGRTIIAAYVRKVHILTSRQIRTIVLKLLPLTIKFHKERFHIPMDIKLRDAMVNQRVVLVKIGRLIVPKTISNAVG